VEALLRRVAPSVLGDSSIISSWLKKKSLIGEWMHASKGQVSDQAGIEQICEWVE